MSALPAPPRPGPAQATQRELAPARPSCGLSGGAGGAWQLQVGCKVAALLLSAGPREGRQPQAAPHTSRRCHPPYRALLIDNAFSYCHSFFFRCM